MLCVFWQLHWLAVPPSLFLSLASLFSETQQYCVCVFFNIFSFKKILFIFGCAGSWLQHSGCFFALHGLSSCSMQASLPQGTWDLSSLTRDQTHVLCIGRHILNQWTTRKVPRHNSFEISPINNPSVTSKCSSERKESHIPLNPKLEVMKLSEEGMWKAETGWKLGLWPVSQVGNVKEFLKEVKSVNPVTVQMIKWNSVTGDVEKVLVVWKEHQTSHSIPLSQSLIYSKVELLSHVWLFETTWTVTYQAPLSMGFSRQ